MSFQSFMFQLLGNSQRPWTKTTCVLPEALAASPERPPQVPSGLGVIVGIPRMAKTDTKINQVYMNVITTLAACCG